MKKDNSRTTEGLLCTLLKGFIVFVLIAVVMYQCCESRARAEKSILYIPTLEDRIQVHEMKAYHMAQGREIVTFD